MLELVRIVCTANFNYSILLCFLFSFCVAFCAVLRSARDKLSQATVSLQRRSPFFRPAAASYLLFVWTAQLICQCPVTSPSIQQAHTHTHTGMAGWLIVLLLLLALLLRTLKPIAFGGRNGVKTQKHMPHHMLALSLSLSLSLSLPLSCLLSLSDCVGIVYKFSHIMATAAIFTTAAACEREQCRCCCYWCCLCRSRRCCLFIL